MSEGGREGPSYLIMHVRNGESSAVGTPGEVNVNGVGTGGRYFVRFVALGRKGGRKGGKEEEGREGGMVLE